MDIILLYSLNSVGDGQFMESVHGDEAGRFGFICRQNGKAVRCRNFYNAFVLGRVAEARLAERGLRASAQCLIDAAHLLTC